MLWKQYVFQMKELGKDTIYYAMNKRLPVLKDETKIFLDIDNVAQEGAMQRIHQELLDFLREGLKNYQVQLEVVLTQNTDNEISLTNPRDKYKSLAKQYPNLNSLRTAFNLDFES